MRVSTWKIAAVASQVSVPVVCILVCYFRPMRDIPGPTSYFVLVTTCCSAPPGVSLYQGLHYPHLQDQYLTHRQYLMYVH